MFSRRNHSSSDEDEDAAALPAAPLFPELQMPAVQNLARLAMPQRMSLREYRRRSWAAINEEPADQPAASAAEDPISGPSADQPMQESTASKERE